MSPLDPTSWGAGSSGGGGASLATEAGSYYGSNLSIPNGGGAALPWSDINTGTAVLSLVAPTLPVVLKAGLFVISVQVEVTAVTVGGSVQADLVFDYTGDGATISTKTVAGALDPDFIVTGEYVLAAGDAIQVFAYNNDGVAARTFVIKSAFVARIGPA